MGLTRSPGPGCILQEWSTSLCGCNTRARLNPNRLKLMTKEKPLYDSSEAPRQQARTRSRAVLANLSAFHTTKQHAPGRFRIGLGSWERLPDPDSWSAGPLCRTPAASRLHSPWQESSATTTQQQVTLGSGNTSIPDSLPDGKILAPVCIQPTSDKTEAGRTGPGPPPGVSMQTPPPQAPRS